MTPKPETMEKPVVTKKAVLTCDQVQKKIHKPDTTLSLEHFWLDVCAEVYDQFMIPFTMQQRGQLKMLAAKCPEKTAVYVVALVLHNWPVFTKRVQNETGIKSPPPRPFVGFLLKHIATAVNYYLDSVKPKQQLSQLQVLHAFKLAQPPSSKHAPVNQTKSTQTPAKLVHETDGVGPEPTQPQPARVKPPKLKKLDKAETQAAWDDYFPHGKPKGC